MELHYFKLFCPNVTGFTVIKKANKQNNEKKHTKNSVPVHRSQTSMEITILPDETQIKQSRNKK